MTTGTELQKKPDATIETQASARLMEGYAGFVNDETSTSEEKLVRLAGLAPVAMQVQKEARSTVERLRDENEQLKRPDLLTGSDWADKIGQIQHNTLYDLYRQWKAVRARVDFEDYLAEVEETLGARVASAFQVYATNEENAE
jgi:hypothetical protein